jgi:phage terminase small subunit
VSDAEQLLAPHGGAKRYEDPNLLTAKQIRFVSEYMMDLNPQAAAIRAGYRIASSEKTSSRIMEYPKVRLAIQQALDARAFRTGITQDVILERLWKMATADPNELMQHRRIACRYCHGIDNQYQWRDMREYEAAALKARNAKKEPPFMDGGFGFSDNARPVSDCPNCSGNGVGSVHIADTRDLTGAAALLYAGVKETPGGVEIKTYDQMKLLELVAKHLGMFKERVELTGPNNGPVQVSAARFDTSKLSLEELDTMEALLLKCAPAEPQLALPNYAA